MIRRRSLAAACLGVGCLAVGATVALAAVGPVACAGADCASRVAPGSAPAGENPPDAEARAYRVIVATNAERETAGLPPLKLQTNLAQAAMWYAQDMADHGHFDHTDRQGRSPQQRLIDFGYLGNWTGENIARGYSSATEVMAAWMESPGHRGNILRPQFREIGVGYGRNDADTYRHYWVQDFGAQQNVFPIVINGEAPTTTLSTVALYIYGSGWAVEMRLRNAAASWTPWQPHASRVGWDLAPGSGKRTVQVELRSRGEVRSAQDEIEVVGAGPPVTATATSPATVPPSPTRAASATPTPTPTATVPPSPTTPPTVPPAEPPTATASPTTMASATRTLAPTATASATATPPPTATAPEATPTSAAGARRLFLPLLLAK